MINKKEVGYIYTIFLFAIGRGKLKMKYQKILIICCISYFVFYYGIYLIIDNSNLQLRSWTTIIMSSIYGISFSILLFLCVRKLFKWSIILGSVGIIGGILVEIMLGVYFLWVVALDHSPEHIVKKDGEKMVASVHSFSQVYVNYYEYKNWFVMGNKCLITERYWEGTGDPFEYNQKPNPIEIYNYDDHDTRSYGHFELSEVLDVFLFFFN